jgi:hypothetical protein
MQAKITGGQADEHKRVREKSQKYINENGIS